VQHQASWVHLWLLERLECSDLHADERRHHEIAHRVAETRGGVPWGSPRMQAFGASVVQAVLQADRAGQDRTQAATAIAQHLPPAATAAVAQVFAPGRGDKDPRAWATAAAKVFASTLIDELDDVRRSLLGRIHGRWIEPWLDGWWLEMLRERRLWRRRVAEPKALPTVQDLAILFAVSTYIVANRNPRPLVTCDALVADWFWAEGADLLPLLELSPTQLLHGQVRARPGWARLLHAGSTTPESNPKERDGGVDELVSLIRELRIEPEGDTLARDEPAHARIDHLIDPSRRPWRPPPPVSIYALPNPFHN
jgi:hypothetical protein